MGTISESIFATVYFPFLFFKHTSLGSNAFGHILKSATFQMLFHCQKDSSFHFKSTIESF